MRNSNKKTMTFTHSTLSFLGGKNYTFDKIKICPQFYHILNNIILIFINVKYLHYRLNIFISSSLKLYKRKWTNFFFQTGRLSSYILNPSTCFFLFKTKEGLILNQTYMKSTEVVPYTTHIKTNVDITYDSL